MKPVAFLSAGLLLSTTLAAPTRSESEPRKMRVPRAIELASQPQNATIHPKDKLEFYNILLETNETRSWSDFFGDMGYNHTNLEEMKHTVRFRSFGSQKTFRAFGMMLAADEVEDMRKIEGVALVQKPYVYTLPEPEKYNASDVRYADYSKSHVQEANETMFKMEATGQHVLYEQQEGEDGNQQVPQVQFNAPYSLQRISSSRSVNQVRGGAMALGYRYTFDAAAGKGVDVYIMDSGINRHREFGRRSTRLWSAWNSHDDDTGHGTHCAGTVGGETVGAAKNANLWNVKVMRVRPGARGAGTEGGSLTRGIEFVISRHMQRRNNPDFRGSVMSISIGGPGRDEFQKRILQKATQAGVHVVIASSNYKGDACNYSPAVFARELPVITVGSVNINDQRAFDSNYGPCVTVYAPGVRIMSADYRSFTGLVPKSGTSMATPLVAGMVADLLSRNTEFKENPGALKAHLVKTGIRNVVKDARSQAPLVNNGVRF
ncbi:hypothetical protein TWF694_010277 [Orbilia ellipsospora]|uniref:Peptidase S8/S53 domain-containing protein n=1 Tax=Orbilia ellipsospora TaxID=2528407 RepID=A0AAV9XCH5_9PEZI